jgi:hypothetical protein
MSTEGMHGEDIHAGDLVALRGTDEDQRVITDAGVRVYNRDQGVVVEVTSTAGAVVDFGPESGIATLSAEQVSNRVELGYSMTCHGGQGVTVGQAEVAGSGIYWRSPAGDSRALLVGMTRGRDANYVIGQGSSVEDLEVELVGQLGRDRADLSPRAALRAKPGAPPRRAPRQQGKGRQAALAQAWAERDSLADLLADARITEVQRVRALRPLHEMVRRREEAMRSSERRLVRMEQGLTARARLFRRHVPAETRGDLKRARAEVAFAEGQLSAAHAALCAGELGHRASPWPDTHSPQLDRLAVLDAQIRHLGAVRGRELSGDPPSYLVAELGEPTGSNDRSWQEAAGEIESYRARWGIENKLDALPDYGRAANAHRQGVRNQLVDLGYSVGVEGIAR